MTKLTSICTLLLALTIGCSDNAEAPAKKPDVVLIVIDTLRADMLGCYGWPRDTSPTIDKLAAEGTRFADNTAQSSWTLPSVSSLLSGRYVTAYADKVGEDRATLAECFQRAGYRTVAVVGNPLVNENSGAGRGFDHFDSASANRDPAEVADGAPAFRTLDELARDLRSPLAEAVAKDEKGERPPLFLYLHVMDPHHPYVVHKELYETLPPNEIPRAQPDEWQTAQLNEVGVVPPDNDPEWKVEREMMWRDRVFYEQGIRYTDEQLALVLAELRELGAMENTVVAIVADHGEGLFEHVALLEREKLAKLPPSSFFQREHGDHLYEELIATPFILWGAGVPEGRVIEAAAQNIDLYPTLLELCDVAPLGELDGRSWVHHMNYRPTIDHLPRFTHSYELHQVSIREVETELKLIQPTARGRLRGAETRLYDLASDKHERTNLAASRPQDVERLQAELKAWLAAHPTETSLMQKWTKEDLETLRALGYTDAQLGPALEREE